jgi:thiol-disulfide isomerase/thioredoxin
MLLLSVSGSNPAYAVETGAAMPNCGLSPIGEQKNINLGQYNGQVLYVDFWASWCGPCAKSFPFMNELHRQLKEQGLQIVTVNLDENLDDAKAFLGKFPAAFTVLADVSKQCAKDFEVKAMPSTYIIDKKGVVNHVHLGFKSGEAEALKTIVEKLLSGKVTAVTP